MATMWLTTFAVAIFALSEVASYPAFQAPTSLADLPIDCPFHREPVGIDHIGDTAYGTLTQTGNYEFSKIPGNLIESGKDYANFAQNPFSQGEEFQNYQQQSYPGDYGYSDQPYQFSDYYPTNFPYYNNQNENNFNQQPEDGVFSILPYYGDQTPEQNIQYGNDRSDDGFATTFPYFGEQNEDYLNGNLDSFNEQPEDGVFSILPYYGDQTPEQNVQYGNDRSDDGFATTFPYFGEQNEDNLNGNLDSFNEQPEGDDFSILPYYGDQTPEQNIQYNEYENPEQENDYAHVIEVIDNCKTNLNAIYEGACEEITEAEETAAMRIQKARARVASQSLEDFGLESSSGTQGFMRGLFSFFKPQNMIAMPMKAVSTGMDVMLSPLQVISKPPAKKMTEPAEARSKDVQKQILMNLSQTAEKNVAKVAQKDVPKQNAQQTVQPEVKNMQKAAARSSCLRSVSNSLNPQLLQNNQEANQCINNAEAQFLNSVYSTRYNVNQQRGIFENRNSHDAEIIKMCANSQFKKCQEEEDLVLKTSEDFATNVNNDLAQISDAEETLKQSLTICEANADTRHEELREEASYAKAAC